MKTEWSHLPNAAHIDRVLESVKAHPEQWTTAWTTAWAAAWDAALDAVENAARNVVENAARNAALDAAGEAIWGAAGEAIWGAARSAAGAAARAAILALIAYDDCAQYLDMPSDKLKVWAILSENPAAVLLLPAIKAFEKIKELELA
jgi:hypothetical protein